MQFLTIATLASVGLAAPLAGVVDNGPASYVKGLPVEGYAHKAESYVPKVGQYPKKVESYVPKVAEYPKKVESYVPKVAEYPKKVESYVPKVAEYPKKVEGYAHKAEGYAHNLPVVGGYVDKVMPWVNNICGAGYQIAKSANGETGYVIQTAETAEGYVKSYTGSCVEIPHGYDLESIYAAAGSIKRDVPVLGEGDLVNKCVPCTANKVEGMGPVYQKVHEIYGYAKSLPATDDLPVKKIAA